MKMSHKKALLAFICCYVAVCILAGLLPLWYSGRLGFVAQRVFAGKFVDLARPLAKNPIFVLLLGVGSTYVGYGPLSAKKNPTARIGLVVIGVLLRLAGPLLLVWDGLLWFIVISILIRGIYAIRHTLFPQAAANDTVLLAGYGASYQNVSVKRRRDKMKALLPIVMLVIVGAPAISGEIPAREKMLIRFILQREFSTELGHQLERRKDLMEELRSGAFAEMLAGISRTDDATMRTVMVLYLGMPWREHLSEVREKIKRALKAEPDKWVKLEMARVLACLGDDAGKEVLVSALGEEGGYMTSSGIEVGKAVLPLLLLNYDFPGGFPKTARNYEGLGGLHEYFDAIRRQEVKAIR